MWSTKEFLIINTKHFGLKDEKTKKKTKKKNKKKNKKKKKKKHWWLAPDAWF